MWWQNWRKAWDEAERAFYDLDDIHHDDDDDVRSVKRKQSAERLKQLIDEILTPKIVEHLTATIGKSPQEVRQIMLWQVEDLMVLHNNLFAYIDRYVT